MGIIELILTNGITESNWPTISEAVSELLSDHNNLIRVLAQFVLDDHAGKGDERKNLLGVYYDEVQKKVTWVIQTAEDVWAGKYGIDKERREALGDDYDIVMARVNATKDQHTNITTVKKDNGGKRYVTNETNTARGMKKYIGFDQHAQGVTNISGSGCGMCSALAVMATFADNSIMPVAYYKTKLASVTGTAKCPISIGACQKMLKSVGIDSTRVNQFSTQSSYDDIKAHLTKGMPVIVSLVSKSKKTGVEDKRYTRANHYSLLVKMRDDGKAFLLDSGSKGPRWVDLMDLCDHIPTASANPKDTPVWSGWSNSGGYVKVNL